MKSYRQLFFVVLITFAFGMKAKAQHDADSLKNILVQYRIGNGFLADSLAVDTGLLNFHIFKKYEKNTISVSHLGNVGAPSQSNVYFDRPDDFNERVMISKPFAPYLFSPQSIVFYNTRRPYTDIFHSMSSKLKDEQILRFTHTQNINPLFNFGFDYDLVSSPGDYPNQESKDHSLSLHGNYENQRWKIHAAFIYNNFKLQENGGIIDTGLVDLNGLESFLTGADSKIVQRHVFVQQDFLFGEKKNYKYKDSTYTRVLPKFTIRHYLDYGTAYRLYTDDESTENGYYSNYLTNTESSYDSVAQNYIENRFSFGSGRIFSQNTGFDFRAGAGHLFQNYFNVKNYLTPKFNTYLNDWFAFARLRKKISKNLYTGFKGTYYITGFRGDDYQVGAELFKQAKDSSFFAFRTGVEAERRQTPFFTQRLHTNHYSWEYDFLPEDKLTGFLKASIPHRYAWVSLRARQIYQYVYYGAIVKPLQFGEAIRIYSAELKKEFHIGRIHSKNIFVWQKSNEPDILNIPEFVYYHNFFLEMNYKSHLKLHVGYELHFSSVYKVKSWNPNIGQFYFENKQTAGNYPIANFFVNAKIKRNVRMFFKIEHLTSGIFTNLYSTVSHYPIKERLWKLGVNWTFSN